MFVLVIRTLILYGVVIAAMRIMGKRQIGEMQPSELVVAIMISDLVSIPMQSIDIPLISGVLPVLTLIVAEIFMSLLTLKSRKLRRILTGEPSVLIYKGHINESELRRLRFNMNDLLEQLRISGYANIAEVEIAVLETNGQLSIIPKTGSRPVTIKELKIKNADKSNLPCMLISDGEINKPELLRSGKNEQWLSQQLTARGIDGIGSVFVASYDKNSGLFIQLKGEEDIKR